MAKQNIIGRNAECSILAKALTSSEPEFIAVYGRRRVGKTFLVREYFEESICFELVGVHNASLKQQLLNFAQSLKNAMGIGIQPQVPKSWFEAFSILQQFLESINIRHINGKRVVFIDELPWFNSPKSGFIAALEHFWNSYGSKQRNLILVVCGSAASWMIQKIVQSKGGLHNRLTRQIRLLPFNLNETELFLKSRGIHLTKFQITSLYMAIGGVPFYLLQVGKGLSSAQIIESLCFSKDGLLRTEFEKLFSSLFDQSEEHLRIIEILRQNKPGLNRKQILSQMKIKSGGTASKILNELEESGFISSGIPFGKKVNDAIFRITDEFTLFYFNWIKPLGKRDPGAGYWLSLQNDPKKRAWSGYAFEILCQKHIPQIKNALGISMVDTFHGPWYYRPEPDSTNTGVQIDLVIDRRDATINLCEMKFSENEFTIDMAYAKELRKKKEVFRTVTKTRKNIFITMITTFGILQNPYSLEVVSNSIQIESLFKE